MAAPRRAVVGGTAQPKAQLPLREPCGPVDMAGCPAIWGTELAPVGKVQNR